MFNFFILSLEVSIQLFFVCFFSRFFITVFLFVFDLFLMLLAAVINLSLLFFCIIESLNHYSYIILNVDKSSSSFFSWYLESVIFGVCHHQFPCFIVHLFEFFSCPFSKRSRVSYKGDNPGILFMKFMLQRNIIVLQIYSFLFFA